MEFQADTRPLERFFGAAPRELARAFRAAYNKVGRQFLAYHRERWLSGRPGLRATTGRGFLSRRLRRHVVFGKTLNGLSLKIFIRSQVARWYEEGATIRPTRSQFLAVPLPPAQTAKGRTKPLFRQFVKGGRRKTGDPESQLFVVELGGRLFLARRRGKSQKLEFLFRLMKRVTMRPRLHFYATWRQRVPWAKAEFFKAVPIALEAARRRARGRAA